jgi:adenylylsulfate kinase
MNENGDTLDPSTRAGRESRLGQHGLVIWFYGLSGAGKSTLAAALERRLVLDGFMTRLLDGDTVRKGLNSNLGFDDAARAENIRRAAEVAKLFLDSGIVTICAFICPRMRPAGLSATTTLWKSI